jgi:hypothetical protein
VRTDPFRRLAVALGSMGLTVVLFSCNPTASPPGGAAARPECPADAILVPTDSGLYSTTVIAASGPISLVPEFHDCQRFTDSARTVYGPMVAIFARNALETIPDPVPGALSTTSHTLPVGSEQASATILNYDLPYEPLRIEKGISCLYLYSLNAVWQARIVPVNSDQACLQPMDPAGAGADLRVDVLEPAAGIDIPPVARWDWDPKEGKHYIGIRCGTRWCEVYSPSQPSLTSSASYQGTRLVAAKGWYDEQYLAVQQGPNLVPGSALGTIFPVGNLADALVEDFDKIWRQVALVSLSTESAEYKAKFNFVVGPAPQGQSAISLCRGNAQACLPATATVNECDNQSDPWWAKIVTAADTRYRCVIRRQHPGVSIPGAARWRWKVEDEGGWVRCPQGCCEIT